MDIDLIERDLKNGHRITPAESLALVARMQELEKRLDTTLGHLNNALDMVEVSGMPAETYQAFNAAHDWFMASVKASSAPETSHR